ncbi:MAG TPA: pyrroline-5-carboxylate reductase [Pseudomonadales bacterium]|nr:pyrroline-5-carboxylate reductase [Pseudomonadales bacterium]
MTRIAFIGGGNMATSIIGGLIKQAVINPQLIHVADTNAEQRLHLEKTFAVNVHADGLSAISNADIVVLAVKPQVMKSVLAPLKNTLNQQHSLLVSIAAGISTQSLQEWSGCNAIVRCMPNTPALIGLGATGLFATEAVNTEQRQLTDSLLRAVGTTVWLNNEADIDAVTAVSGSGPAYFFLLIEAMTAAGQQLGLSAEAARLLTLQTAVGASQLAQQADVDAGELRKRVTSPGGTTEQAILSLENSGFRAMVNTALQAAKQRAEELSKDLAD